MEQAEHEEPAVEAPRLGTAANPSRAEIQAVVERWLGRTITLGEVKQLTGGLMTTILEANFDDAMSPVVLKISGKVDDVYLDRQAEAVRYTLKHTGFPMPEIYEHDISGSLVPYSYILMPRTRGENLGKVKESMSEEDHTQLLWDMADFCADMHSHEVKRYGMIGAEESWTSWTERTAADFAEWDRKLVGKLTEEGHSLLRRVIDDLPNQLEGTGPPCLVHGDIWSPNIIVHEKRLECFLDHEGLFWPDEKDLADLEIWGTVDKRFFDRYREHRPDDGGYDRRRKVHWLGALLIHVDLFGEGYIGWSENLMREMLGLPTQ
jgi:fructosamine-3-kinase